MSPRASVSIRASVVRDTSGDVIDKRAKQWFDSANCPDDVALVYFAGHADVKVHA